LTCNLGGVFFLLPCRDLFLQMGMFETHLHGGAMVRLYSPECEAFFLVDDDDAGKFTLFATGSKVSTISQMPSSHQLFNASIWLFIFYAIYTLLDNLFNQLIFVFVVCSVLLGRHVVCLCLRMQTTVTAKSTNGLALFAFVTLDPVGLEIPLTV
jgi:hypothetical protein